MILNVKDMEGKMKPIKHDWSVEDYEEYRRTLSRNSQKKRREEAKKKGMCSICCRNKARKDKLTCAECSERIANRAKIRKLG
jgi:hypothetical protein